MNYRFLSSLICLTTYVQAGCIIRTVTNNSTDAEIVVLDVERPRLVAGTKKFSSPQGTGWSIQPKRHYDGRPNQVRVDWGAGAYKYILVREKGDGLTCHKYCLLISPNEIVLKRRENCIVPPNEKCGGRNDDFPDEMQKLTIQQPYFIDLYLNADGHKLTFKGEPQPNQPLSPSLPASVSNENMALEMPYARKVINPEL